MQAGGTFVGVERGIPAALLPGTEPTTEDSGLDGGEIAAIVIIIIIVAVVAVIVVVGIIVFSRRRRQRFELITTGEDYRTYRRSDATYVTDAFQSGDGVDEKDALMQSDVVVMHSKEDTPPSETTITNTAAVEDEEEKGMKEDEEDEEQKKGREKAVLNESSKDTHL